MQFRWTGLPLRVFMKRADLDEWAKDATPVTELRCAFHSARRDAWPQFVEGLPAYIHRTGSRRLPPS